MELHWGTGEFLATLVEEGESSNSDAVDGSNALIGEFDQMLLEDAIVNLLSGLLGRLGHVERAVEGHKTGVDPVVTATNGGTAADVLHIDNVSELEVATTLVKLVAFNEELKQGVRRLGTVFVNDGHVQVIDEEDHLLASGLGSVGFEGSLINVLLNDVLEVAGGGTGREVDVQEEVLLLVELAEGTEDSDSLGGTRVTTEHHRSLVGEECVQQPRVTGGVDGGHKDGRELPVLWGFVLLNLLLPKVKGEVRGFVVVVVQVGRQESLGNLSDERVELLAIIRFDATTHGPDETEDEELFELNDVLWGVHVGGGEDSVNQVAELLNQVQVGSRSDLPKGFNNILTKNTIEDAVKNWGHVLEEEFLKGVVHGLAVVGELSTEPVGVEGSVAQVLGIHVDHTAAGNRGEIGRAHV